MDSSAQSIVIGRVHDRVDKLICKFALGRVHVPSLGLLS